MTTPNQYRKRANQIINWLLSATAKTYERPALTAVYRLGNNLLASDGRSLHVANLNDFPPGMSFDEENYVTNFDPPLKHDSLNVINDGKKVKLSSDTIPTNPEFGKFPDVSHAVQNGEPSSRVLVNRDLLKRALELPTNMHEHVELKVFENDNLIQIHGLDDHNKPNQSVAVVMLLRE
jgi:hypothetical protein